LETSSCVIDGNHPTHHESIEFTARNLSKITGHRPICFYFMEVSLFQTIFRRTLANKKTHFFNKWDMPIGNKIRKLISKRNFGSQATNK